MISYEQFAAWLESHDINPNLCERLEMFVQVPVAEEAAHIVLRAHLLVEDEDGSLQEPWNLRAIKDVPLVSLP
jgi:hypothetical protein